MRTPFNKPITTFAIVLLTFSFNAISDNCSILQLNKTNIDGDEYIYEILSDNNLNISERDDIYQIAEGNVNYLITPGWHTISALQWRNKDYRYLKLQRLTGITNGKTKKMTIPEYKQFKVFIEDGKKVVMSPSANNLKAEMHIVNSSDAQCDLDFTKLTSEPIEYNESIGNGLEYRLRTLMNDIYEFQLSSGMSLNNLIPSHQNLKFGAILDNQFSQNPTSLTILAVSPASVAEKFGLRAGDKIVQLGESEVTNEVTPLDNLNSYLSTGQKEGVMAILRDNQPLTLSGELIPNYLSEISYYFNNNRFDQAPNVFNQSPLSDELMYRLSQLTLELESLDNNDRTILHKKLTRKTVDDYIYGMTYQKIRLNNNGEMGIVVKSISPLSQAAKVGLQSGDIISSFNSIEIAGNHKNLQDGLIKLKTGEEYKVVVVRQGQEKYYRRLLIHAS
ncbi:PDZ domain-containing protein [Psychrosphaera aquimarina]|uniref:PDZ domain-containing protein n=1 Tax=Psychrosphaera aquimarina TaxID=2044854 RepID=A0ABU3QY62_9GAMM|nr:PDZ domain-containing protein [Psychrosphaera aquimarina]MDU0112354.1 PDZ domain-containing protein [Psychrosphaera aquimarina]